MGFSRQEYWSGVPLPSEHQKSMYLGFPGGSDGKVSACNAGDPVFHPWVRKIPWRWAWQLTPTFLPGESHGQRSLVGYSPQGPKESNMTKHVISLSHMYLYMYKHTCILNNLCNLLFYVLLYNVLSHSCNNSKVSTNYTFFYSVKILDYINSMKTRKSELHYKLYMLNYWWLNC